MVRISPSPTDTSKVVPNPGTVSALNSDGLGTIYGDLDPAYDDCSNSSHASSENSFPLGVATGQNIGNLLNARNISWGWFQGGFAPTGTNAAGYAVCGSSHKNIGGATVQDYVPHHDPFQYYKSTANPKHLPPSSEAAIGRTDQANHQYDISDFYQTLTAGNMPAVSLAARTADRGRLLRRDLGQPVRTGRPAQLPHQANFRPVILDPTTGEVVSG